MSAPVISGPRLVQADFRFAVTAEVSTTLRPRTSGRSQVWKMTNAHRAAVCDLYKKHGPSGNIQAGSKIPVAHRTAFQFPCLSEDANRQAPYNGGSALPKLT